MIGRTADGIPTENALESEISIHQDILIPDFIDSYDNLTLKISTIHQFVNQQMQGENFDWLVIQDDDTFIDFKRVGIGKYEPNSV